MLAALLTAITACGPLTGIPATTTVAPRNAITPQDGEVIKTILQLLTPTHKDQYVVVVDQASAPPIDVDWIKERFSLGGNRAPDSLAAEMIADYDARNSGENLSLYLKAAEGIEIVSPAELKSIFMNGVFTGWEQFHNRFPGATALVRLSLPGYAEDHTKAIIYLTSSRGALAGVDKLFFLEFRDGRWIVKWNQTLIQS